MRIGFPQPDVKQDKRRHRFNPLMQAHTEPDYFDRLRESMTLLAAQAAEALDSLPLEHDVGLIRNVVYSGIWVRFEQLYAQAQKKEKKP